MNETIKRKLKNNGNSFKNCFFEPFQIVTESVWVHFLDWSNTTIHSHFQECNEILHNDVFVHEENQYNLLH